ncbi:MAG: response regulator [Clostridiales bacterium]|jgi:two-component system response regulator YesN|nr:response regulator [Clostridiales bacterium]
MYHALFAGNREIFVTETEKLRNWKESAGFLTITQVGDSDEALSSLRDEHFDLIITDIHMPKMTGVRLLLEIKKIQPALCVAFFSEYSDFEYARYGMILGAFDYFTDFSDRERFMAAIRRARTFSERKLKTCSRNDFIFCPAAEAKNMLAIITFGSNFERIPELFEKCAKNITRLFGEDSAHARATLYNLFAIVRAAIFAQHPWLKLYIGESATADYASELRTLIDIINRLIRPGIPQNMRDICTFILENPESKVTLSVISSRFYLNNTYLSAIFHQKTGWRFNDYVMMARMERARCLLYKRQLKIYEISGLLGYRDTNYFNRLFKKYFGKTPTEFQALSAVDSTARFASNGS